MTGPRSRSCTLTASSWAAGEHTSNPHHTLESSPTLTTNPHHNLNPGNLSENVRVDSAILCAVCTRTVL